MLALLRLVIVLLVAVIPLHAYEQADRAERNQDETRNTSQAAPATGAERQPATTPQTNSPEQQPVHWYSALWARAWAILSADVTPQWALVILTVAGACVAWFAFKEQRDAVRLTQRADILLEGVGFHPQRMFLGPDTVIRLTFKNYGPTRASNVRVRVDLTVPGVPSRKTADTPELPEVVVGPQADLTSGFSNLGTYFDNGVIAEASKGKLQLFFEASVMYNDVFGRTHHTVCKGRYNGERGNAFLIEENHEAD